MYFIVVSLKILEVGECKQRGRDKDLNIDKSVTLKWDLDKKIQAFEFQGFFLIYFRLKMAKHGVYLGGWLGKHEWQPAHVAHLDNAMQCTHCTFVVRLRGKLVQIIQLCKSGMTIFSFLAANLCAPTWCILEWIFTFRIINSHKCSHFWSFFLTNRSMTHEEILALPILIKPN